MDDVIKLIAESRTKNKYGVEVPSRTYRQVFCQVHSVTRDEFYNAGRNGLNPEWRFTMFHGDYGNETIVEYKGETYAVYRTYLVPGTDYIELYVQREGGTNGKESDG